MPRLFAIVNTLVSFSRVSHSMLAVLLAVPLLILVQLASPGLVEARDLGPIATLDQICVYLESGDPDLEAVGKRQLETVIVAQNLEDLRLYLNRPLAPRSRYPLSDRLHKILMAELEATEAEIENYTTSLREARRLAAALEERALRRSEPPLGEDEESLATLEDEKNRLQSLRTERDQSKSEIRRRFTRLTQQGIALAPTLWMKVEQGGRTLRSVARFREELWVQTVDDARRQFPSAPDPKTVPPFVRRCLVPLCSDLALSEPESWNEFRTELAQELIDDLNGPERYQPGILPRTRQLFLELGQWGVAFLNRWAESTSPEASLNRDLSIWNRYRVPSAFTRRYALDLTQYEELNPSQKLLLVARLEWTAGDVAIPIFVEWLEIEENLGLKVELAGALARLDDPRGGEFLRRLGLESAVSLERVSERVLLLEAIHRREAGELQQAIVELKEILRRFPGGFRAHYELAYTSLLAREFDQSIQHFRKALELEPQNRLAHYNLACAYALSGRSQLAIVHLKASIENGFRDVAHIETDPDLNSLREEPGYKRLIQELKTSNSP